VFAKYNVLQDVGYAVGALLAALPSLLQENGLNGIAAFRTSIGVYAVLSLLPLLIGAGMKIIYDLVLWRSFRGLRPPEERA
jgi:hypothetical protein